jgi:hypothetical protein
MRLAAAKEEDVMRKIEHLVGKARASSEDALHEAR